MEATQLTELTEPTTGPTRSPPPPDPAWVSDLRDRLLRDAFLFDDPRVYRAGVEDALANVEAVLRVERRASVAD